MAFADRRSHTRRPHSLRVACACLGQRDDGMTLDVSPGGAFVCTRVTPAVGSDVVIEPYHGVAGGKAIQLLAEVRRLRDESLGDGLRGIGVKWRRAYCSSGADALLTFLRNELGASFGAVHLKRALAADAAGEALFDFETTAWPSEPLLWSAGAAASATATDFGDPDDDPEFALLHDEPTTPDGTPVSLWEGAIGSPLGRPTARRATVRDASWLSAEVSARPEGSPGKQGQDRAGRREEAKAEASGAANWFPVSVGVAFSAAGRHVAGRLTRASLSAVLFVPERVPPPRGERGVLLLPLRLDDGYTVARLPAETGLENSEGVEIQLLCPEASQERARFARFLEEARLRHPG